MFLRHRSGRSLEEVSLEKSPGEDVQARTLKNDGISLEVEEYHAPSE